MNCHGTTPHPSGGEASGAPHGAPMGRRLKMGLLSTSCLWLMVGGFAVVALAGPALGVPGQMAALGLLLLCPLSMVAMMATMGRHGHGH